MARRRAWPGPATGERIQWLSCRSSAFGSTGARDGDRRNFKGPFIATVEIAGPFKVKAKPYRTEKK